MSEIRVRFAPSPTGKVHIGNIRAAIYNWLYARHTGGKFLLRVEDTDLERSTPEAIKALFDCMEWLGLDYDEPVFYQTKNVGRHLACVEKLLADCPFYAKLIIGKDVYGTPEDCQTVTVKATLVADASVSDDVAYAIVKTIFENKEEITAAHAKGAELDLTFATDGMAIPFHPGAAKYFAENGITVDTGA